MPLKDLYTSAERLMSMTNNVWARHANPLSVYSRVIGGSAVFFALWSPFWLGWWGVVPILAACAWIWLNPRLFPAPRATDTWATQGVLGERVFLNRNTIPIPVHHIRVAHIATVLSAGFFLIVIAGFFVQAFWLAFTAWHAATLAKIWFCDRMVWLWQDMKDAAPQYRAWQTADWR